MARAGLVAVAWLSATVCALAEQPGGTWPPKVATFEVERFTPDWDRVANIKKAAKEAALLHRDKGPKAVFEAVAECYKKVDTTKKYSEQLEFCSAQDTLEVMALSANYAKLSPEVLKDIDGAKPEALEEAAKIRMSAANNHAAFSFNDPFWFETGKLVGAHGYPAFLAIAFPDEAPKKANFGSWDHAANIKDAAGRLAILHKREGTPGVLKFLDACYQTHLLANDFSQGLEACMAQDYMNTQLLAAISARVSDDERRRLGVPSPELFAQGMGRRFLAAFSQYKVTPADADQFRKLVDKHGYPAFLKAVLPEGAVTKPADGATKQKK